MGRRRINAFETLENLGTRVSPWRPLTNVEERHVELVKQRHEFLDAAFWIARSNPFLEWIRGDSNCLDLAWT